MRKGTTLPLVRENGRPWISAGPIASSMEAERVNVDHHDPVDRLFTVASAHSCEMNTAAAGPSAGAFAKFRSPAAFTEP